MLLEELQFMCSDEILKKHKDRIQTNIIFNQYIISKKTLITFITAAKLELILRINDFIVLKIITRNISPVFLSLHQDRKQRHGRLSG